jgi:phosphoglycolate phosphatase-like HAD superfamily hydrolase
MAINNIIFDIDGTLADASHRAHLIDTPTPNWAEFLKPELVLLDDPIPDAQRVFNKLMNTHNVYGKVWFLTGRNESLREVTLKWLYDHFIKNYSVNIGPSNLIMRPIGNMDKPTVYKKAELVKLNNQNPFKDMLHGCLAFDDDPYMQSVYMEFGMIPFKAPDCWGHMFKVDGELSEETYWRR